MLFKLALRNVRRSVRDYAIYFVTLLFGVAVFYAFNSIGQQKILFDLEQSATERMFDATQYLLGMFSVVVAFVLAFLIMYANRFLIRRRKHEFGTYLTLGMSPGQTSRIVLYETASVGLASLVAGLALGVLLSQALSFATAALFGVSMTGYRFVFSKDALLMTLGCFALIYAVVAALNVLSISRCKIRDLLAADARNERVTVRSPRLCLVGFVIAVGILAFAYQQLIESGMVELTDPRFLRATVCMLVGTLMLFWSAAGFAIAVITRSNSIYLRGLRPFTVRQITSKINTAFVSLWAVCVLLFLSITTFSCGMGMVDVFTGDIEAAAPYDATLQTLPTATLTQEDAEKAPGDGEVAETTEETATSTNGSGGSTLTSTNSADNEAANPANGEADAHTKPASLGEEWDIAPILKASSSAAWESTVSAFTQVNLYPVPGLPYGELFDNASLQGFELPNLDLDSVRAMEIEVVAISQLNASRALTGDEPLSLGEDECMIVNNLDLTSKIAKAIANERPVLDIAGSTLTFCDQVCDTQVMNSATMASVLLVAVPDTVVESLEASNVQPVYCLLNATYAQNSKSAAENDIAFKSIIDAAVEKGLVGSMGEAISDDGSTNSSAGTPTLTLAASFLITSNEMITQSGGLKFMITYLALYIGFVFLVSTAAILAIQQLSETADSLPRYRALYRLGCDERQVRKSLLSQIMVYFLAPLLVAACHSACAIRVLSDSLFGAFGVSTAIPIALAAALTVAIYGGYLLVTYLGARSVVNGALQAG